MAEQSVIQRPYSTGDQQTDRAFISLHENDIRLREDIKLLLIEIEQLKARVTALEP